MDPDSIITLVVCFAAAFFIGFLTSSMLKRPPFSSKKAMTEDTIKQVVQTAGEQDVIDAEQQEMIDNIFDLSDVTAGEIMTHRTELAAIEQSAPISEAIEMAISEGFSRLPVFERSLDNIVGILYVKDLLFAFGNKEAGQRSVSEVMRSPLFVPEACRAKQLLFDLREKHTHAAVVVDEYGGTSGLVTMEDILEQIVGNIIDEFDSEEDYLVPTEGGVICDGGVTLEELSEFFDIEFRRDEDEEFETVSGLIIEKIGHIPSLEENIYVEYGNIGFEVREVSERKIQKVFCSIITGEVKNGKKD